MNVRDVKAADLRNGMLLYSWSKEAHEERGVTIVDGPDGYWSAMVIANNRHDWNLKGRNTLQVHRVDVFFWNELGHVNFDSFFWSSGRLVPIIET